MTRAYGEAESVLTANDIVGLERDFATIDDPRWNHCHASTVVVLPDAVLVAWFAGSAEGAADTGIWAARREHGTGWCRPERADTADGASDVPHWNPALAFSPEGELWLFYKVGHRISQWQTLVRVSPDAGRTWKPAAELVRGDRGGRGPVRNPPVVIDGRWFAPGSVEQWPTMHGGELKWDAFVDISDDGGQEWERAMLPLDHSRCRGAGAIQPALWRNAQGGVTALCRSSEGRVLRSSSLGAANARRVEFSPLEPTALPNNNSGLGAASVDVDGRRIVVCAHNSDAEDWGSRATLALSASDDDGLSWYRLGRIDGIDDGVRPGMDESSGRSEESASVSSAPTTGRPMGASDAGVRTDGVDEYSYPTVLIDGSSLFISYTWQRRGIVLASMPVTVLQELVRRLSPCAVE